MVQEIQIEDEKWDRIVKSFERYDIFYLNHYVKGRGWRSTFNLCGK